MNFSHLLFSFDGRISRKVYFAGIALVTVVMWAVLLAGTAVFIGDPISSQAWAPESRSMFGWLYGGVSLLILWPVLALAAKRLHDRGYSVWIGVAAYLGMAVIAGAGFWFGALNLDRGGVSEAARWYVVLAVLVMLPAAMWLCAQLMFMRGVPGENAWGPDPLVGRPLPGYEPKTFFNVVFNPDGRMSRGMWWLMFVSLLILLVIWGTIYGMVFRSVVLNLPQANDPAWLASPEGQQAFSSAMLPYILPLMIVFYLMVWPALAAGTKRLHDRGHSGWVLTSYYVPFALMAIAGSMLQDSVHSGAPPEGPGLWLMIAAGVAFAGLTLWLFVVLGFLKGQPTENAYGPPTTSRA